MLDETTDLAVIRTRLAAERTLMAWIRTAFSMITFGFAILNFFQFLHESEANAPKMAGVRHLGLFLILLGTICIIPGMIEHGKQLNFLSKLDGGSRWSYASVVAVLISLLGLYLLFHVMLVRLF